MSLVAKLRSWIRPAPPVVDPADAEETEQVEVDHEADKTSALAAPPALEGQKFWEP